MFKLVKIIPMKTDFRVMRHSRTLLWLAAIMCAASAAIVAIRGLSYGIDFSGGLLLEIKTQGPADVETLRAELSELSPSIQSQGQSGDAVSIYLAQGNKDELQISADLARIKEILDGKVEYRNTQVVGPKVGSDLVRDGIIAVILSILAISIYIGIRFELPFAVGSVLSLSHDIIIALAMLSLAGFEFDLTMLAALLTLAGYSINDTVVIYDRVRENLKKHKSTGFPAIIDLSINETFSRTILTGLTTMFALSSIYLFGGATLKGFAAVMLFGIIIGTYSSMFVSTSTLLMFNGSRIR